MSWKSTILTEEIVVIDKLISLKMFGSCFLSLPGHHPYTVGVELWMHVCALYGIQEFSNLSLIIDH